MIKQLLKTQKKGLIILMIFGLLSALSSFYMNYVRLYVLDFVFGKEYASFAMSVVFVCTMIVFTYFADNIGWDYFVTKVNLNYSKIIKLDLHSSYEKMCYSDSSRYDVGYLTNLQSIGGRICDYITSAAYSMTSNVLEIILSIMFIIIFIHYKLLVFMLIMLPMTFVVHYIGKRIAKENKILIDKNAVATNSYLDYISKLDFVKANNFGNNLLSLFKSKIENIKESNNKIIFTSGIYSLITSIINFLLQLSVPIYGAYLLSQGEISAGALINASLIFSSFLSPSMFKISSMIKEYKSLKPLFAELGNFHKLAQTNKFKNIYIEKMDDDTLVILDKIKYYYQEENYILNSIDLELPPTGMIGIMGKSGGGKSTLIKIISGLLSPFDGSVKYNSKYISDYSEIDSCVSYVTQEPHFFTASIINNINNYDNKTKSLAKEIGINDVIESLPDEYETELSENGSNLSGGQKQTISILRGLSKKSCIYIFDESTSSLDEDSEIKCLKLLEQVSKTACVLIISHRKKTLDSVDVLYELRDKQLLQINKMDGEWHV